MNKYNNLECSILSCILIDPKLMDQTILKDKHFQNYQSIWKFMKSFYKKFGTFDITLMCSVCKEKHKFMQYIINILETEPTSSNFNLYEKQIVNLYNENEKEKWLTKKIYETTCDLLIKNIETKEFKENIEKLYNEANKLFSN